MRLIREIKPKEDLPIHLFLLADPEMKVVESYINRSIFEYRTDRSLPKVWI